MSNWVIRQSGGLPDRYHIRLSGGHDWPSLSKSRKLCKTSKGGLSTTRARTNPLSGKARVHVGLPSSVPSNSVRIGTKLGNVDSLIYAN